jgi:hypothetical protein
MKSKLVVLRVVGIEAKWSINFLIDLPIWPSLRPPISLHCDSQATLLRVYSKSYNGKSRYISLRHNTIRQLLEEDIIIVDYVKSSMNLVDPFTKELSKNMIHKTSFEMSLKPIE